MENKFRGVFLKQHTNVITDRDLRLRLYLNMPATGDFPEFHNQLSISLEHLLRETTRWVLFMFCILAN